MLIFLNGNQVFSKIYKQNRNYFITLQAQKLKKMNRFSIQAIIVLALITGSIQTVVSQEAATRNIVKALQTPDSVTGARVNIYQDKRVDMLLAGRHANAGSKKTAQGYRVQVFSSNTQRTAKTDAFRIERQIKEAFPDANVYVNYISPFWKVRVGDFLSHEEAQRFRQELTEAFPQFKSETYIVREQIFLPSNKD